MAELTTTDAALTASCCSTEVQATCCEPSAKASCCGTEATGGGCGCSAGQAATPAEPDIREVVRERYAQAARAAASGQNSSCGCSELGTTDASGEEVFGAALYADGETEGATATAVQASLGCGVPTAVAALHEGETVLDLGSARARMSSSVRDALASPERQSAST